MSCRELIESLRRANDDKVRTLWDAVETEAGKARVEMAARIARLRAEQARSQAVAANAILSLAVSEAHARSRQTGLIAEKVLADRLFEAARAALPLLRENGYKVLFEKLSLELPALSWQIVRVNPGDVELAIGQFPGAEVVPDERISGGMDASAENGAIRVVNTFERRLERAWQDMLPHMIGNACTEVSDGASARH